MNTNIVDFFRMQKYIFLHSNTHELRMRSPCACWWPITRPMCLNGSATFCIKACSMNRKMFIAMKKTTGTEFRSFIHIATPGPIAFDVA